MFTPHTTINHYLRVATWNIRVPFPPDVQYNLSWKERRRSIAYAIETHEPDLLAVQEDCYFMNEYLMNSYNTHTNNIIIMQQRTNHYQMYTIDMDYSIVTVNHIQPHLGQTMHSHP